MGYLRQRNLSNECSNQLISPEWPHVPIQNCVCKLGCRKNQAQTIFEARLRPPTRMTTKWQWETDMKIKFLPNHSHSTKRSVLAQGQSKGWYLWYWLFGSAMSSVHASQRVHFVFWETLCPLQNSRNLFAVLKKHASPNLKAAPAPWAKMPCLKSLWFTLKVILLALLGS